MTELESADFISSVWVVCEEAHKNSKDKGFWDQGSQTYDTSGNVIGWSKPWNLPEKLALMHSELSEWLEAYRKGIKECDKDIRIFDQDNRLRRLTGMEEEAADLFIRLADLCFKLNIDLGQVVLAKMQYNASRPHMHGGRKC